MITVNEAYTIIENFSNPFNNVKKYSDQQTFNIDDYNISYENQKEHWLAWLKSKEANDDFMMVYNHIKCAPMLVYLADSLDIDTDVAIKKIKELDNITSRNFQKEATAFKEIVSNDMVLSSLESKI